MHNGCHLLSTYYMPVSVDKDRGSEGKKEKEEIMALVDVTNEYQADEQAGVARLR